MLNPIPVRRVAALGCLVGLALLASACGDPAAPRRVTIGIVNYVPVMNAVVDGFKERMTLLGYAEGRNVTYLYSGALDPKTDAIEREVQAQRERRVDLVLTVGTRPAQAAKKAFAQTGVPIVFAPVINPVEEGLVSSITRPGGQVTGVQNGDTLPKSLEWLHAIVPGAKKIHVIYHPRDHVSLTSLKSLQAAAPAIGIELVALEAGGSAQALALIGSLPRGSVLFLPPAPSLYPMDPLLDAAAARSIAVGMNNAAYLMNRTLMNYGAEFSDMGRQAARMADQILKGSRPADLPVETPEYALTLNLQMARQIGLEVPDAIISQAHKVLR
ncbi:MAG TPA: ABC transporter substrate-binding protein [Burkholderiaceae bacterium]|nr:ABC transporter substrate-binding protein [Burkholderiaceae bacterium]